MRCNTAVYSFMESRLAEGRRECEDNRNCMGIIMATSLVPVPVRSASPLASVAASAAIVAVASSSSASTWTSPPRPPSSSSPSSARSKKKNQQGEKTTAANYVNWCSTHQRHQQHQKDQRSRSASSYWYSSVEDSSCNRNRRRSSSNHVVNVQQMKIEQAIHSRDGEEVEEIQVEDEGEKIFLLDEFGRNGRSLASSVTASGTTTPTTGTTTTRETRCHSGRSRHRNPNPNLIHSTFDRHSTQFGQHTIGLKSEEEHCCSTIHCSIAKIEPNLTQPEITASVVPLPSCSCSCLEVVPTITTNHSSRSVSTSYSSGDPSSHCSSFSSSSSFHRKYSPLYLTSSEKKRNIIRKRKRKIPLKWTKDSIFWLRFWSQRHRFLSQNYYYDHGQDGDHHGNIRISFGRSCTYWPNKSKSITSNVDNNHFSYYPFVVGDANNNEEDIKCCLPHKSSSLTSLLPFCSFKSKISDICIPYLSVNDCKDPLISLPFPYRTTTTTITNSTCSVLSNSNDSLDQTRKKVYCPGSRSESVCFEEYYNRDKYLEESNSATNTICLSTIMEILPLVLLLIMGIIISTTCAKYTFQSSPSGHTMFNSMDHKNSTTSMLSRTHTADNQTDDHLMMGDEESPSVYHQLSDGGGRPRYAGFHGLINYYHHSPKPTGSPSGTSQQQQQLFAQLAHQYSAMHLRWLSNSSVTCNDGTRAGYYIRPTPTGSRRWLIFLEGGWYCMSKSACDQRWYKMRDFMTSFRWSQYKTFSGILSSSPSINPYLWNANHVFIPYCSSDIWSGDSPAPPTEMAFLGSRIIDEVIGELIRNPVYQFIDAKFVLLAGSSAGAAGVMINLDRVAKMIADAGSNADVRGLADSGWILDNDQPSEMTEKTPKMTFGLPSTSHQQKFIPCAESGGNCSPTETIKGAYRLWNSRVPEACAQRYPTEPWRCYFGYRLYPTLTTPLFVVQFQYDEFQIYMDGMTSRALNDMEKMRYIRSLSDHMTSTLANVSAVFVPSCMAHILLTKLDWHKISIRGITLPEALNCWEQTPVNHNNRYHRYNHHHHHRPHYQLLSTHINNSNNKFGWTTPKQNNQQNNILLKQRFASSSSVVDNPAYKSDYLFPDNHPQDEQNELSQFYSPSSLSSSTSSSSSSSSNLLNYLTLKHPVNHTITYGGYYSHQQIDSKSVQQKIPKILWKLHNASDTELDSATSNTIWTINQTASNRTDFPSSHTQTSGTLSKKRKKRKRRKGHHHNHHRKSSVTTPSTTSTTDPIQNDGHNYPNIVSKSLHSYYQTLVGNEGTLGLKRYGSNGQINNPTTYWKQLKEDNNKPSYLTDHFHSIRMCHFRLIDDRQYPERNQECPRLQFNQNNNHNNRDKSYLERKR